LSITVPTRRAAPPSKEFDLTCFVIRVGVLRYWRMAARSRAWSGPPVVLEFGGQGNAVVGTGRRITESLLVIHVQDVAGKGAQGEVLHEWIAGFHVQLGVTEASILSNRLNRLSNHLILYQALGGEPLLALRRR